MRRARASLAAGVRPAEACGCTPTLLGATFLDHVQVSEEVGGGEPGEEPARSGHE